MTDVRTYMGCNIYPMGPNSWGGRWESYVGGRFVTADTLAGIRDCIRQSVGKSYDNVKRVHCEERRDNVA